MIAPALLALAIAAAPSREVVARVDAVVIDRETVAQRDAAFRAQRQQLAPAQVIQNLVDEVLLAAEAEQMGLRKDPDVQARMDAARRRLAASAMLDAEVAAAVPPEPMLREMYHSSSDFARVETLVFETREAAQAARERIVQGGALTAEANRAVISQLYATADKAPYLLRAQLAPALAEAVFAARPGAIVGPVAAGPGFTVARVLAIVIGDEAGFAEKRASLAEHARKQMGSEARAHLVQGLRAAASVRLDESFLKGLHGVEATAEEQQHVIATVNGRPLRYGDVLPHVRTIAASSMGGHMTGPTVRIQTAWQEIDARLVQDLAVERGFDRRPEVTAQLPGTERNLLALAAAERIRAAAAAPSESEIKAFYDRNAKAFGRPFGQAIADAAAGAADEKRDAAVLARVEDLRKKAAIVVDQAALARAVGSPH
jgi:hypothetical protein